MIKVLIADDSVVYRTQIRKALASFAEVEILGTASNGVIAIERLKANPCDLLILDLEMPEMDGLQTLAEIVRLKITVKTLVFSSSSKRGADITFEALRLGAKDFVSKPGVDGHESADPSSRIQALLEPKLRAFFPDRFEIESGASDKKVFAALKLSKGPATYPALDWNLFRPHIVVVGSSTGGPTALETILTQLPAQINVPILIAQHMPPIFTASLAERLERLSGIRTKEAIHGEILERGTIYIAPGDFHMTLTGTAMKPIIQLDRGPHVNSVRPAVDPLFTSAANLFGHTCLGIVLTGMGQDGRAGTQAIKAAGGAVVIQNRETCVVYGMPGAVEAAGTFDRTGSLEDIAQWLREKICFDSALPKKRTA